MAQSPFTIQVSARGIVIGSFEIHFNLYTTPGKAKVLLYWLLSNYFAFSFFGARSAVQATLEPYR